MAKAVKDGAKSVTYWAPYARYSFYVPVIDIETGKPVIKRSAITDAVVYSEGKPMYQRVQKHFENVCSVVSKGLWCRYQTSDEAEIAVLDKLVADTSTAVMTDEQHDKRVDPAFDAKKELTKVKAESIEKDDTIAALQKQLEELTRPSGGQSPKGK